MTGSSPHPPCGSSGSPKKTPGSALLVLLGLGASKAAKDAPVGDVGDEQVEPDIILTLSDVSTDEGCLVARRECDRQKDDRDAVGVGDTGSMEPIDIRLPCLLLVDEEGDNGQASWEPVFFRD